MRSLTILPLLTLVAGRITDRGVGGQAPYHQNSDDLVTDEYRVLLRDDHTLDLHFDRIGRNLTEEGSLLRFNKAINGYHARLDSNTMHQLVRFDPGVDAVEHNSFHPPQDEFTPGEHFKMDEYEPLDAGGLSKRWSVLDIKRDFIPVWDQVMVNAGKKVEDFWEDAQEFYAESGEGVNIYILDSGIDIDHYVFEDRARHFTEDSWSPYTRDTWFDTFGHGTHVGGVAARHAFQASIINVKVIGDNATDTDVINAIDDVVARHNSDRQSTSGYRGAVINMSFKEVNSDSLKKAIASAISAGIPVVTSAGNENDTKGTIPCGYPSVVCVAAVTKEYKKLVSSNQGEGVTIAAPGDQILSAKLDLYDKGWYTNISGTSQASAVVAAIVAHYIGYENIQNDVPKVLQRLYQDNGVKDLLTGFLKRQSKTPNLLVNTGYNNPNRLSTNPYYIPHDELKFAVREDELLDAVETSDESVANPTTTTAPGPGTITSTSLEFGPETTIMSEELPEKITVLSGEALFSLTEEVGYNTRTENPTDIPTDVPTNIPTDIPTDIPTNVATNISTAGGSFQGRRNAARNV